MIEKSLNFFHWTWKSILQLSKSEIWALIVLMMWNCKCINIYVIISNQITKSTYNRREKSEFLLVVLGAPKVRADLSKFCLKRMIPPNCPNATPAMNRSIASVCNNKKKIKYFSLKSIEKIIYRSHIFFWLDLANRMFRLRSKGQPFHFC